MKVTYCSSPVLPGREFTMANRILTENVLRNDKLDVKFNYSVIGCYNKYEKQAYESLPLVREKDYALSLSYALWKDMVRLGLSSAYYPKKFVETIQTDVVLMSCVSGFYDYPFIVELLNSGFKVVLGGSNFRLWMDVDGVKRLLLELGLKQKYINNFIIVSGMVDLTTDLYEIIKDWKHLEIRENDLSTVWKCERDYFQSVLNSASSLLDLNLNSMDSHESFINTIFLTNNRCWWRKCSFCGFKKTKLMDFDSGVAPERIAENIIATTRRFKTNTLYFSNDYFVFTKKHKRVLEILLKEKDYRIRIWTGILMLNNQEYIDNVNKYNIKHLRIGLESGTDFSLSYLNKGYGTSVVDDTVEKLKGLKKDIEITLNTITDAAQTSKEEVRNNYENILRWKTDLRNSGYRVQVIANSLGIVREINDKECVDNRYIIPCSIEKARSGRIELYNSLKSIFGEDIIQPQIYDHFIPFNRYDKEGKILSRDFDIIPIDLIKKLYDDWGWAK